MTVCVPETAYETPIQFMFQLTRAAAQLDSVENGHRVHKAMEHLKESSSMQCTGSSAEHLFSMTPAGS